MASPRDRKGETEGDGSYASIGERSMLPGNRGEFFQKCIADRDSRAAPKLCVCACVHARARARVGGSSTRL